VSGFAPVPGFRRRQRVRVIRGALRNAVGTVEGPGMSWAGRLPMWRVTFDELGERTIRETNLRPARVRLKPKGDRDHG
jgi:hypothetical protein